jgi:hypothetical protein
MNHPAVSAARPAPLAPYNVSGRIIYAPSEAEAVKLLALRLPIEAAHAAKCAAEAAAQAAKAAERKAARKAARVAAAHAEASKAAASAAFDTEWAALLSAEERQNAAKAASLYWVTGEGKRPALSAVTESTWSVMVVGLPRRTLTARNRPGFGADGNPAIGQGSRTRPGQNLGLAHEAPAERTYTPVYNAAASVGL